jgi:predicted anti-sigma-YlaC factor YlaD
MKDEHILNLLDNNLNEAESASVKAHAAQCESCHDALQAAKISSAMFRTAQNFEPSPYFQAKVLNAIREKKSLRKPIAAFWRWWQASAALVGAMVMIVVSLIALTIFAPATSANDAALGANDNPYSAEAILFNQKPRSNLTTEQTLEIIYETKK